MTSSISPATIQRLAYCRFLFNEGLGYCERPAPLSATAVLMFHDAVENFLGAAADFLRVNVNPRITFLEYWGQIKPVVELPGQAAMRRLNDARVSFKHHGTFPSEQTVRQAKETVTTFFADATPLVFGTDFDTIDMVDLVTLPEVAKLLREAHTHMNAGDILMALAGLDLAMAELLRSVRRLERSGRSPFAFDRALPVWNKFHLSTQERNERLSSPLMKVADQVEPIRRVVTSIQSALAVLSLGIDYPKYTKFLSLTPRVQNYYSGPPRFSYRTSDESRTAEEYAFCRMFVIESCLAATRAVDLLGVGNGGRWQEPLGERAWTGAYGAQPGATQVGEAEPDAPPSAV
ncbi:hypothetical protein ACWERV_00130 [Streptomyces sp. NPDC004031]